MFLRIKSTLFNFIQSYLSILIILALGLFTYWQTLYLNKNQLLLNPSDLSKSHIPLYELKNADFTQHKQLQSLQNSQYHIRAKTAVQYADDKNFELTGAEFKKTFSKGLQKQSQLSISGQTAQLDAYFNELKLQEKVQISRETPLANLKINAKQAHLKLREDVLFLGKMNAEYKNLKTAAKHQFSAEKATWDEQKQRLDAQGIKIHFENPGAANAINVATSP
jgi:LPS export ABC transporter protein LptC